jgi:hypothetical protein
MKKLAGAAAGALGALVLAIAVPAAANGRFPASNAIYFAPDDPSFVVLRTTFGLVISHDGGDTWAWTCDQAVGISNPSSTEDPVLGITQNGTLVAARPVEGLTVSPGPDQGCSWGPVPEVGAGDSGVLTSAKDVAVRPDNPHAIVALRSVAYASDAGTAAYATQVYESTDDGAHWGVLGTPIDPNVFVTTVDVAGADPHRLYVSGFRQTLTAEGGVTRTGSLFVSRDDGATWTERPVPLDPATESAVYIAAIDPTNADKLYVRSEGASRLMVTSDAGQTFTVSKPLGGNMLGFALSPDGRTVWFGGAEAGLLLLADPSTLAWTPLATTPHPPTQSSLRLSCLAAHGSDLWACSDELSGFAVGVSHDGGMTFTPKLHLEQVRQGLACPAGSPDAGCDLSAICGSLGSCGDSDAGVGDSGGTARDAGAALHDDRPTNGASPGCSIGERSEGAAVAALVTVAAAAVVGRRRRRGSRR